MARRFEAIVFDWDGTAVPNRRANASSVRRLVEEACATRLELAIVSGTHVDNVDGQLVARPTGPGRLLPALNRGSEVFHADRDGPRLVQRRIANADEDANLSRAAQLTVEQLAARGLKTQIVSERLNRRKIDLIPEPIGQTRRRHASASCSPAPGQVLIAGDEFGPLGGLPGSDSNLLVDTLERVHELLLTLADGRLGTRNAGDSHSVPEARLARARVAENPRATCGSVRM